MAEPKELTGPGEQKQQQGHRDPAREGQGHEGGLARLVACVRDCPWKSPELERMRRRLETLRGLLQTKLTDRATAEHFAREVGSLCRSTAVCVEKFNQRRWIKRVVLSAWFASRLKKANATFAELILQHNTASISSLLSRVHDAGYAGAGGAGSAGAAAAQASEAELETRMEAMEKAYMAEARRQVHGLLGKLRMLQLQPLVCPVALGAQGEEACDLVLGDREAGVGPLLTGLSVADPSHVSVHMEKEALRVEIKHMETRSLPFPWELELGRGGGALALAAAALEGATTGSCSLSAHCDFEVLVTVHMGEGGQPSFAVGHCRVRDTVATPSIECDNRQMTALMQSALRGVAGQVSGVCADTIQRQLAGDLVPSLNRVLREGSDQVLAEAADEILRLLPGESRGIVPRAQAAAVDAAQVAEAGPRTDVFLTHDWGVTRVCGEQVRNHERVARINKALQGRGLRTWFDEEQLKGDIIDKMRRGIDNATGVVVFATERYIDKVSGDNSKDNCKMEFGYAHQVKSASKMLVVVMEEACKDTSKWKNLGFVLGNHLYVDFSKPKSWQDEQLFQSKIAELHRRIIGVIGKAPVCSSKASIPAEGKSDEH